MKTCQETFPGGNVCSREVPCTYHEHADVRESYLRREVQRLRDIILKVNRDADWSIAGTAPHDWRKGLDIIKTDTDEIRRELES